MIASPIVTSSSVIGVLYEVPPALIKNTTFVIFVRSTAAPPDCVNLFVKSNDTFVNELFILITFATGAAFVDFPVLSTKSTRIVKEELFLILIVTVGLFVKSTVLNENSKFSQPGPTELGVTTN